MSKRHELDEHLRTLGDMRGILGAMKNLALMETQKLTRYLATQRRAVGTIEAAAADFFTVYPEALPGPGDAKRVYLLIGSERGFCGDFNDGLVAALARRYPFAPGGDRPAHEPLLIAVGHKLSAKLGEDARVVARVGGPTVAEDIQPVLRALVEALREVQAGQAAACPLDLTILHHRPDSDGVHIEARQPLSGLKRPAVRFPYPPVLNLAPRAFVAALMDQYLFAVLHEVFYSSLMAENTRRFQQMDQALQHLDKQTAALMLRRNSLRQEEITEEIEIIMLSAEALRKA